MAIRVMPKVRKGGGILEASFPSFLVYQTVMKRLFSSKGVSLKISMIMVVGIALTVVVQVTAAYPTKTCRFAVEHVIVAQRQATVLVLPALAAMAKHSVMAS